MLDRKLVCADDSLAGVLRGLLTVAKRDQAIDLATLYWGDQMDEAQTGRLASEMESSFPEIEFEVVYGGQPHYHLFVSME